MLSLQNETLFRSQLRQVRSEQMGPLSASSMEVGSYKRSYEFIVRLHMLKELEEGVQSLLGMGGESGKQTTKELLCHWGRRLEATQVRKARAGESGFGVCDGMVFTATLHWEWTSWCVCVCVRARKLLINSPHI